jgi:hypothetical protein
MDEDLKRAQTRERERKQRNGLMVERAAIR